MRRLFCEGESDDSAGCPPGPAIGILVGEIEKSFLRPNQSTAEQSQVLTQEMEIVVYLRPLSQQYPSAIAGSSWGSALGDRLGNGGACANLRRRSHFGASRRRRRECNLHPR
jgi:hypothetical protein